MNENVAVVAMDVHKVFSKAVMLSRDRREPVGEAVIRHGSKSAMSEFLGQFSHGTPVVLEATFNWPWIVDVAEERGLCPHLAHPARAREMAKQFSKTDRKDAIWLGRLYLSGSLFPEAYLAPSAVRDMRSLLRQRMLLVKLRVTLKNNVHGQLFRLGIASDAETTDLFNVKGRKYLKSLELPERERQLLDQKLEGIDYLNDQIKRLANWIARELKEDPRAGILMSIPGIGVITAYTLLAEIGTIERFPNGRALAAYGGVLPLDKESGGKEYPEHTATRCNKYLKWALVEAVTGAVRGSARMKGLYERVKSHNGGRGGKAKVAVARELAELVHYLLSRGKMYVENAPARPGSRESQTTTDPNRARQTALSARSEMSQAAL